MKIVIIRSFFPLGRVTIAAGVPRGPAAHRL
jgi:hypothetical protein